MKDDKKKTPIERNDELVSNALSVSLPPLYNSMEIDGIIIKQYPFIRGNSKIYKQSIPKKEIDIKDYTLLSVRKNELETQIELHRKYCIGKYNHIQLIVKGWLRDKLGTVGAVPDSDEEQLMLFASQINTIQGQIMLGVEMDEVRSYIKDYFPQRVEVLPVVWGNERTPVIFDIDNLIKKITPAARAIERIVLRTVTLYFEYVNIQSKLYELDIDSISELLERENKLSTAEGRIAFVESHYYKNNGSQNPEYTWDNAVNDANKESKRVLYKDGNSFMNARRNLRKRTK